MKNSIADLLYPTICEAPCVRVVKWSSGVSSSGGMAA